VRYGVDSRGTDAAVSAEVLRLLRPLGVEAALKALEVETSETAAVERQLQLALAQARYEVDHARRQRHCCELVATSIRRVWPPSVSLVNSASSLRSIGPLPRSDLGDVGDADGSRLVFGQAGTSGHVAL
jgi:hypothetical protein